MSYPKFSSSKIQHIVRNMGSMFAVPGNNYLCVTHFKSANSFHKEFGKGSLVGLAQGGLCAYGTRWDCELHLLAQRIGTGTFTRPSGNLLNFSPYLSLMVAFASASIATHCACSLSASCQILNLLSYNLIYNLMSLNSSIFAREKSPNFFVCLIYPPFIVIHET